MRKSMAMIKSSKYFAAFFIFTLFTGKIIAQGELQREVRVIKPYTPTLSDANKISLLPEFNDTVTYTTDFEYGITPRKYSTNFRLTPIKPAKMVGLPLSRLYKSQFTLGIGNYNSPLAELTINQLRNRKNAIGLYAKHYSSNGKIRHNDTTKVDAPFSENELRLYGRRMFSRSALEAGIGGGYKTWQYYGFNPNFDTTFRKSDNWQKVLTGGADITFYSTNPDSSHLDYSAGLNYYYLDDNWDVGEHGWNVTGKVAKFIGDWYAALNLGVEYYDRVGKIDSIDNSLIRINPTFSKTSGEWRFKVGLNSTFDTKGGQTDMGLYPLASFEFNIVKNVLIPYFGVSGDKKVSSYKTLLNENPYIIPGLIPENEDYKIIGEVGLKGRYSSKMAFDFNVNYSRVNYMHLFVNNYLFTNPRNQFRVVHDNVDVLNASAEVIWDQSEKLRFVLRGDYFDYSEEVYHKPNLEIHLNTAYNLRDKILVKADLFYTGKRLALMEYNSGQDPEIINMKGFFDGNIKAEYRYTRMLSFFVKLNNFSASKYEQWYFYPVQRFQVMGGFSYAL